ncbi:MAG: arylesterase [Alphaproteobacteria bacterium]|nr:arylesterase [Alphaproteobacteria bacterium]
MSYLKRFIGLRPVAKYTLAYCFCLSLLFILQINAAQAQQNNAQNIKLVLLGDSLVAGYGLPQADSFAQQLQTALITANRRVQIINAGVSGDTSAGGAARFEWSVPDEADAIMIALGGNDLLRGLPPANMQANLESIIVRAKARKLKILLVGQRAPPNMGADYMRRFNQVFPSLAEKHELMLYPFFLQHVAGIQALNQPDGIHPNKQGVAIMVAHILPFILTLLDTH